MELLGELFWHKACDEQAELQQTQWDSLLISSGELQRLFETNEKLAMNIDHQRHLIVQLCIKHKKVEFDIEYRNHRIYFDGNRIIEFSDDDIEWFLMGVIGEVLK